MDTRSDVTINVYFAVEYSEDLAKASHRLADEVARVISDSAYNCGFEVTNSDCKGSVLVSVDLLAFFPDGENQHWPLTTSVVNRRIVARTEIAGCDSIELDRSAFTWELSNELGHLVKSERALGFLHTKFGK